MPKCQFINTVPCPQKGTGWESFLKERQCKVACCTYHNAEDEAQVCSILEGLGYSVSVSDGYVLFLYSDELRAPFFRRGVVRARRG